MYTQQQMFEGNDFSSTSLIKGFQVKLNDRKASIKGYVRLGQVRLG